jgi:pyruvate/2-oxoglutarate/acetoin dehydrogenase E1 component
VRLTQTEAVIDAIAHEMRRGERVLYIGQDIGAMGGSLQGTQGLLQAFGPRRIREAPISESAMVGAAIGAALFGRRPIVEISFGEFLPAAMNQLVNQAANLHYMTGGVARVPVVIRTRVGDGPYGGHPQDYSAWFAHVPGLKVVMPGHPADARALMLAAIRDDNPVLFFEPMALAHGPREEVPAEYDAVPIGYARLVRPGRDVTVVAIGSMVLPSLEVARQLADEGIELEVIDLRSIQPLDTAAVVESVQRTGRLVTVHEAWVTGGLGAEVVAAVAEAAPAALRAPVVRVGTAQVPTPSGNVRPHALPNAARIGAAVRRVLGIALAALVSLVVAVPAFGQPALGAWQAGPGAAGDNTYAGLIEAPANGSSISPSGLLSVSGWFVDTTAQGWAGADDIQVFLGTMDNGTLLGHAMVGLARPDVGSALGNPYWSASGWRVLIDPGSLPPGQDALSVYAHTPQKGSWFLQTTVSVGQVVSSSGEPLAPAPALQGLPPVVTVTSPGDGQIVSTRLRSLVITGTAKDPTNGVRGIDWVEVWFNGEANSDHGAFLGVVDLLTDGTWSLPFDPGAHEPIDSNLYVYAHSGVNGKKTLTVRHFILADRPL